jgi:hypothetical protein
MRINKIMNDEIQNDDIKYSNLDIDLNEFDKNTLIYLIVYAHENNLTFNKVIETILKEFLSRYDDSAG